LAVHCAVLWNPTKEDENDHKDPEEYVSLVKYLLEVMPETLDLKSAQGYTPLHLAVSHLRHDIVKLLISKGANQRIRDSRSRNIVHNLLVKITNISFNDNSTSQTNAENIGRILALLDKEQVKEMLLERCSTSANSPASTPLAYYLSHINYNHRNADVMKLLVEYSGGDDLELINGEGDLPLHTVRSKPHPINRSLILTLTHRLLKINTAP
jgi:ankyrin repeat protein